ncbi:hypothetical protein K458DRAFT_412029 [Lentithecium fluviatile CBS 122367]|uniref:Uncharacterized protein n=1 Tax=Lentithecium fluviatile CBS 122367 TaxID=1168545 RepID=A0A6G1JKC7_9PLEO|nr:hypothetical protein K458DRAFT_412029 [Lentithecium fluviatile CBS 122367]
MYAKALSLAVLSSTAFASQYYQAAHYDFGAMLKRGEALAKRQGYYPTTTPCGDGDTCAEACGAETVQCPSSSGLYCFDPTLGACCPDNSGYACDNGYFCTTDGMDNTYCCPDGMDLVECAAAYSLTVSLIRETGTVSIPTGTDTPIVSATTTPIHITPTTYATTASASPSVVVPTGNGTYTTATATTAPPEFTGAAAKAIGQGMAVLAGAAGLVGLL